MGLWPLWAPGPHVPPSACYFATDIDTFEDFEWEIPASELPTSRALKEIYYIYIYMGVSRLFRCGGFIPGELPTSRALKEIYYIELS